MKNKKLLILITSGMITALIFWACERYSEDNSKVVVTANGESFEYNIESTVDTCMNDLLPYQNDFNDTGSILIGFINDKPLYTASIWSFSDSTHYYLDVDNDTINLSNGEVYFHSQNILGNNPVSVTINDTTYLSPDTIYLGTDVSVWKICVNPLSN